MTRLRTGIGVALLAVLLATGCSGPQSPGAGGAPSSVGGSGTVGPDSATPGPTSSGTASPAPDQTATPLPTATQTPGATGSPGPTGTPAPVSCSSVEPVGIGKVLVDPRRVTEVATVVSDGRTLTTGSAEETDLVAATLTGPNATVIVDPATLQRIAALVAATTNHSVQLERPAAPDARADVSKRPFNSPGTYAMFNASSPLTIEVMVNCSGQQQTWRLRSEGDPARGTVNCAVEPGRGNVLGRGVYQAMC